MLLLLACASAEPGVACTEIAAASSLIHVVDESGAPLVAEIAAVDEEGNAVTAECANEACTDWIVGYEVVGEITITVNAYDGCNYGTGVVVVDVPLDEEGCHVVQQEATLEVGEWTDLGCFEE